MLQKWSPLGFCNPMGNSLLQKCHPLRGFVIQWVIHATKMSPLRFSNPMRNSCYKNITPSGFCNPMVIHSYKNVTHSGFVILCVIHATKISPLRVLDFGMLKSFNFKKSSDFSFSSSIFDLRLHS
jgi:hypothetical protein